MWWITQPIISTLVFYQILRVKLLSSIQRAFLQHMVSQRKFFSDNGPAFASRTHKQFCKEWDISHDTSSPEYSNSNGLVERTIQTVKRTLRKAKRSNNDVHLDLLALKSTPGVKSQPSPAYMFFDRNIRTVVPSVIENTGLNKNDFSVA